MLKKVLVANRGEIAVRIIRTLDKMGIGSVAVYSPADRYARHVEVANEAYALPGDRVEESYLRADLILDIAKKVKVDGIHPGYGFLSENADFCELCEENQIAFIGPSANHIRTFGLKHWARKIASENQVSLIPGTGLLDDHKDALVKAEAIGYPVMLKSTAGGGGIGMSICNQRGDLEQVFSRVQRLSENHFGEGGIFLEKFLPEARHLEVQAFGDGAGNVITLGIRDCSVQRRNQKVIEETPPIGVPKMVMDAMEASAKKLLAAVQYKSAGTVEYVYNPKDCRYYFLEVNTRLQVEHGVTELVCGVDLVEWMVKLAAGEPLPMDSVDSGLKNGHAIEVRIYAEDPHKNFQPSSGELTNVSFPSDVRCDHWVCSGTKISPYYDPLLAKIQVYGYTRKLAREKLMLALESTELYGIETNLDYLKKIVGGFLFINGKILTKSLSEFRYIPSTVEILQPGTLTTVQDFPGRRGYWEVGIPPSGPMDDFSFQLGNRLLGNLSGESGLEMTAKGAKIRFNHSATIISVGAKMKALLDGKPFSYYVPTAVGAGSILEIGAVEGGGVRTYLLFAGGLDVPDYLGSKSTFPLGGLGGHAGRRLRSGDVLRLKNPNKEVFERPVIPLNLPAFEARWEIGVIYGPHGSPDFFTQSYIDIFFQSDWEVHYNSDRTGVRLLGEKPGWARKDGGEAGLHPSNIHDNPYAVGTIDFTGDMPIILGPDGPSLGGFVSPATVIDAELWKLGQLRPGDRVRFRRVSAEQAETIRVQYQNTLEQKVSDILQPIPEFAGGESKAVLLDVGMGMDRIVIRSAGNTNVLVEYGPIVLDLQLRLRVHFLYTALREYPIDGLLDLTPGIRSLQVHFDPSITSTRKVIDWVRSKDEAIITLENQTVPSRVLHLPLCWDDPSNKEAIEKYEKGVRRGAPWCPDNIEFIRRINGLESKEAVYDIVFKARYLVMGLGDVYLGAPVATPLDPRHRLVTTKYNPARTWTPENAVGIGGAYLCIYGMEGPGGYQLVGRTLPVWNRFKETKSFVKGKPWLLRFFDQIQFYPVSAEELKKIREDFPEGRFHPKIDIGQFNLSDYQAFLETNATSIRCFQSKQEAAFKHEREHWDELSAFEEGFSEPNQQVFNTDLLEGLEQVESPVSGTVWKLFAKHKKSVVKMGQTLAILSSMKMEIEIVSPCEGLLECIHCGENQLVTSGDILFGIKQL